MMMAVWVVRWCWYSGLEPPQWYNYLQSDTGSVRITFYHTFKKTCSKRFQIDTGTANIRLGPHFKQKTSNCSERCHRDSQYIIFDTHTHCVQIILHLDPKTSHIIFLDITPITHTFQFKSKRLWAPQKSAKIQESALQVPKKCWKSANIFFLVFWVFFGRRATMVEVQIMIHFMTLIVHWVGLLVLVLVLVPGVYSIQSLKLDLMIWKVSDIHKRHQRPLVYHSLMQLIIIIYIIYINTFHIRSSFEHYI